MAWEASEREDAGRFTGRKTAYQFIDAKEKVVVRRQLRRSQVTGCIVLGKALGV